MPGVAKGKSVIADPDVEGLGPAMRALNVAQRRFVIAMALDPFGSAAGWARAAGYQQRTLTDLKVTGHRLVHDPRIEMAVREYAAGALGTLGPMVAAAGMLRVARDPAHPKHLKALELIANRVGMHERHEQVVVHRDQTGDALIEQIKGLAERLGVPLEGLLGGRVAKALPVSRETRGRLIEGEVAGKGEG